jgi:hypothetical protein
MTKPEEYIFLSNLFFVMSTIPSVLLIIGMILSDDSGMGAAVGCLFTSGLFLLFFIFGIYFRYQARRIIRYENAHQSRFRCPGCDYRLMHHWDQYYCPQCRILLHHQQLSKDVETF